MKAMVLERIVELTNQAAPLRLKIMPRPEIEPGQLLLKVSTCGVCHTELDEIEGRTPPARLPMVLGHQVVGQVVQSASKASRFKVGQRVGVAWIYSACGKCDFCIKGLENLCPGLKATGRDAHGG